MSSIKANDVLSLVNAGVASDLKTAAGANNVVSRIEERTLAGAPVEGVEAVRAAGGPGTHVTVDAASAASAKLVGDLFDHTNQTSGSGKTWLSRAEVDALASKNPDVGARALKAWTFLAAQHAPAPSAADVFAKLTALSSGEEFDALGSEEGQAITPVVIDGSFSTLDATTLSAVLGPVDSQQLQGGDVRPGAPDVQAFVDAMTNPVFSQTVQDNAVKIAAILNSLKNTTTFIGQPNDPNNTSLQPTWIVGVTGDGKLAGIKTNLVWT